MRESRAASGREFHQSVIECERVCAVPCTGRPLRERRHRRCHSFRRMNVGRGTCRLRASDGKQSRNQWQGDLGTTRIFPREGNIDASACRTVWRKHTRAATGSLPCRWKREYSRRCASRVSPATRSLRACACEYAHRNKSWVRRDPDSNRLQAVRDEHHCTSRLHTPTHGRRGCHLYPVLFAGCK